MDATDVGRWFGEYLEVFAACGRGEREPRTLLDYWAVPMLVTTDDGAIALSSEDEVVATAQHQVDGMLASGFDHTNVVSAEIEVMNAACALYRGEFSRRRADGDEIGRLTASYLVADGRVGRRISALVVHSALLVT